jgi:hypothetical protein
MKDYFSHDYSTREDEKIKNLIYTQGWTGYGIYWGLVESLYLNEGYMQLHYERIAFDMRTEPKLIESIINDFGLFKIKGDKFYSESILRRLNIRNEKSEKARQSALKRWESDYNDDANALQSQSDGNAIIVKNSKVKNSKDIIYSNLVEDLIVYSAMYFDKKYLGIDAKETFRKLIELDLHQVEEIKDVIKSVRSDEFWSKNFMSPNKLRSKDKYGVVYYDKFITQFNIKRQQPKVKTIILTYNGVREEWPADDIENGKINFSQKHGGFDTKLIKVL